MSNETKATVSVMGSIFIIELVYLSGMTPGQLFCVLLAGSVVGIIFKVYGNVHPLVVLAIAIPIFASVFISPDFIVGLSIAGFLIAMGSFRLTKSGIKYFEKV